MRTTSLIAHSLLAISGLYVLAMFNISFLSTIEFVTIDSKDLAFLIGADSIMSSLGTFIVLGWGPKGFRGKAYFIESMIYGWITFTHAMNYRSRFDGEEPREESLSHGHSVVLKVALFRQLLMAVCFSSVLRLSLVVNSLRGY